MMLGGEKGELMKKMLLVLLTCLLVIALVGCGNDGEDVENTSSTTVSNTDTPASENKDVLVKINSKAENILFFGERETLNENYFTCDSPASGFEIKIKVEGGSLKLRIATSGSVKFCAWVDGVAQTAADGSEYFSVNGSRLLTLDGIADGEHTLRFIRVSDGIETAQIYEAIFKGEHLSYDVSDRYFIEFIGDEITSGGSVDNGKDNVTKAYSYLASEKLGADRAVTVFENAGFGNEGTLDLYGANGFKRNADMIVINVGRYELAEKLSADEYAEEYKAFIKKVRYLNGKSCKVLCLLTLDNSEYNNAIKAMLSSLGGDEYGNYFLESQVKSNGALTVGQHSAIAEELYTYISLIKDATVEKVQLKTENDGAGSSIDYNGDEWILAN